MLSEMGSGLLGNKGGVSDDCGVGEGMCFVGMYGYVSRCKIGAFLL